MKKILFFILAVLTINLTFASSDSNKAKIKAVYDFWETGTKEEWMNAYTGIMADDFERWNGRYVGLGFRINQEELTVLGTTNAPASDYLKAGDKFLSVNGMEASAENVDDLPFQGKLGGEVTVVVDRDGEEMTFTMKRATQVNDAGREEVIQNLTNWTNFDMRPKIKSSRPLVAEDNVVIGTFQLAFTDADGNEVTWWVMERFVFNEDGELAFHADLSEELFLSKINKFFFTYLLFPTCCSHYF